MQNLHLVIRPNLFVSGVIALGFLVPLQCYSQTAPQLNTAITVAAAAREKAAPAKPAPAPAPAKPNAPLSNAQAKAELAKAMAATTVVKKGKVFPAPHTAT